MEETNQREIEDIKNLISFYSKMKETNSFITTYVTELETKLTELTSPEQNNESYS
jgi:hypothetical protein